MEETAGGLEGSGMYELTVENLRKVYGHAGSAKSTVAIDDLTFKVDPGEIVAIVGKTGCGKSTFLRILLGLERPTGGRLLINDYAPYEEFGRLKGVVGVVFQEDCLLPWRTALANVTVGLEILGVAEKERVRRANEWLATLGLEGFENAFPGELSGGMRQRVALARAFTTRPQILLADEAFGHLDEVTAVELRSEFLDLVRATGSTTLFVTHQLHEATSVGDRVLVFGRPGRVLMEADVRGLQEGQRRDVEEDIKATIGLNSRTA